MARRLLVVGADGLLGRALVARGVPGVDRAACDVTCPADRERILDQHLPDAVFFCAAESAVDRCEEGGHGWTVNVEAPLDWAQRVPLWFISSNYVFAGPGPHGPTAVPCPLQAYGRQKLAAERGVLARGSHVVRTGWLYGPGGANFPSSLPRRLLEGRVRAVADVPVQPTWVPDLAALLLSLPGGLTHAIGCEETTWAEFANHLAERLGLTDRVEPVSWRTLNLPAPRPMDARLVPASLPGWRQRAHLLLP